MNFINYNNLDTRTKVKLYIKELSKLFAGYISCALYRSNSLSVISSYLPTIDGCKRGTMSERPIPSPVVFETCHREIASFSLLDLYTLIMSDNPIIAENLIYHKIYTCVEKLIKKINRDVVQDYSNFSWYINEFYIEEKESDDKGMISFDCTVELLALKKR